jgi:hypothetical protein
MADERAAGGPRLIDAMLNPDTLKVALAILVPGLALIIGGIVLLILYT